MGPFKVKALYEYTSNHEDDLPFQPGQIITVIDEEDADWYVGEYVDDSGAKIEGIFPRNFVEKYEPTAPPRPTRTRKAAPASDASPSTPAPAVPASSEPVGLSPERKSEEPHQEPAIASPPAPPNAEPRSPPAPVVPVAQPPQPEPGSALAPPTPVAAPANESPSVPSASAAPSAPPAQPSPKEPTQSKKPPPVAGKSNAFKDRIAAFNKPAAPPVAPFKPGGLSAGPSGFVKKPFVAPPPSRNAYIPPPQQSPATKIYRREEDPEIKERQVENQDNAEKAGLAPAATTEGEGEDQPKPTSLKERIALLQRQQAEQATRHAEAAKKKPKRPPPKRTESESTQDQPPVVDEAEAHPPPPEHKDTAEHASKKSLDVSRASLDEASPPRQPPPMPIRRKSTKEPVEKDGNEADMSGAGDTTEGPEDITEKEDSDAQAKPTAHAPEPATADPAEENAEEEEEDEDDPEVRRREELRARMAKMSGGMGFHGMFGPPGMAMGAPPMPPKKKKPPTPERRSSEMTEPSSPRAAPPIPTMMALPGLGKQKAKEEPDTEQAEATEETATPVATATSPKSEVPEQVAEPLSPTSGGAPPIPGSRPAPPPVPTQSRPPPPPPPAGVLSPGSETDDELSERPLMTPLAEALPISRAPPPPPVPVSSPPLPSSPRASVDRGYTRFSTDEPPLSSPPMSPQFNKRNSRPPPPPPSNAPPPTLGRPPPPPPPGGASRPSTSDERVVEPMKPGTLDNGEEAENTEYEGDYDTDIASSAPHKGALKSHSREWSLEEDTPHYEAPPTQPPPPPAAAAPSTGPPPVPSQPPPSARMSMDKSRAPPPPPTSPPQAFTNEDYDPFNYNAAQAAPAAQASSVARYEEEPAPEITPSYQSPPPRGPPLAPQPPREPPRAPPRKSLDVQRVMAGRRSTDQGRASISAETGFMANEVELATQTNWWLSPNGLPPVFQGRKDIYTESTEATSSTPEGRTVVTKEVLILYQDYSQTAITILFDPQDPSSTEIDQRHEPPPRTLRQDQLESAYETYGRKIATAIASRKDSVGDGTSYGLISELLKPFQDALRPVGTRSYGALVYANLANASTQMNDEIRPGDIVSFRNAKFSGKHGPMHAKYSTEVGKPDHVGVVAEWDGTKKKVRAWEQGRESKKCKQESFKLEDLRSGEVKVWRVMPRSWVGWSNTPGGYSAASSASPQD